MIGKRISTFFIRKPKTFGAAKILNYLMVILIAESSPKIGMADKFD
jgi:hypothetical protein